MNNPWVITPEERRKHAAQFQSLKPVNGFITGDQARNYFILSTLPSNVLAHIWNLADVNKDGRMDLREFSIAVCLIQKKLAGFNLPQSLPDSLLAESAGLGAPAMPMQQVGGFAPPMSMRQPTPAVSIVSPMGTASMGGAMGGQAPMGGFGFGMTPPGSGMMIGHTPPGQMGMQQPMGGATAPGNVPGGSILPNPNRRVDWAMPPGSKLKHSQMFNSLDKGRVGTLSGAHARNILSQSGLPHATLAQIWTLSDVDKDGKLSCDEFCIAMHLIDKVRAGEPDLPSVLPPELRPTTVRARTTSFGASEVTVGGDIVEPPTESEDSPRQQPLTFEDRIRQNRDKAQAELERRRQILQEQERREREERERKEREEEEKRERERQEQERRRQAELEKELARQREIEQMREAERRRIEEQKRAAQEELEKQRRAEMDKLKLQEIRQNQVRNQEAIGHLKQKEKNLTFQVQALNETAAELNQQIVEIRTKMMSITSGIESKRPQRDALNATMGEMQMKIQQANQQLAIVSNEKAALKNQLAGSGGSTATTLSQLAEAIQVREANIAQLAQSDVKHTDDLNAKESQQNAKNAELAEVKSALVKAKADQQSALTAMKNAQAALLHGQQAQPEQVVGSTENHGRVAQYRALYAFTAQNEDELSFQPGDMITVFLDHAAVPGWLAGSFQGKVGWFPATYAEDTSSCGGEMTSVQMSDQQTVAAAGPTAQIAGKNVAVLDGIREEGSSFEADAVSPGTGLERSRTHDSIASQDSQKSRASTVREVVPPAAGKDSEIIAQALYSWKAKKDGQLTFTKGDQIIILAQDEMMWKGQVGERQGWFPKSYVKIISEGEGSRRGSKVESPQAGPAPVGRGDSTVSQSFARSDSTVSGRQEQAEVFVAMYPFVASEPGDLEFQTGDHITVVSKEGDWWTGRTGGKEGIFPANYVQKLEQSQPAPFAKQASVTSVTSGSAVVEHTRHSSVVSNRSSMSGADMEVETATVIAPFTATHQNQLSLNPGDSVRVRAKSPNGWWEGELSKPGGERRSGWFPGHFVRLQQPGSANGSGSGQKEALSGKVSNASIGSRTSGSVTSGGKRGSTTSGPGAGWAENGTANGAEEWVEALFDYTPQQDDELELTAGCKVKVVARESEAWWRGLAQDGREGVFPANYVQQSQPPDATLAASGGSGPGSGHVSATQSDEMLDLRNTQLAKGIEAILNSNSNVVTPESDENTEARKLRRSIEEIVETEKNYIDDLEMVKRVFFDALKSDLTPEEHARLQSNWKDLQRVAKNLYKALKAAGTNPGATGRCFMEHLPEFNAFLLFCSTQQVCLDLVDAKCRSSPAFMQAYTDCTQHPAARGLQLGYYILIPMTRIIRYPLLIDKVMKYAEKSTEDFQVLQEAHDRLRALCREVDQIVSQVDSLQMLHWCQEHVKCEPIKPNLVFNSQTHSLGPRVFLHSGVLHKARTGRLLVALLFNDVLLLTTPDEQIEDVPSFKVTRTSDVELTLYRSPVLLAETSIVSGPPPNEKKSGSAERSSRSNSVVEVDEPTFSLITPKFTVYLKCSSMSQKTLWYKEITKAIDSAKAIVAAESSDDVVASLPSPLGRLLLEVMPAQGIHIPPGYAAPIGVAPKIILSVKCDGQKQLFPIILDGKVGSSSGGSKPTSPQDTDRVITQIMIRNKKSMLNISFLLKQLYAPDLVLGSVIVSLEELLQAAGFSRNPTLKQFPLNDMVFQPRDGNAPSVVLKYVFHMIGAE